MRIDGPVVKHGSHNSSTRKHFKPRSRGALVIIGGAEDRANERKILRAFVQLAGGAKARIVIIAVAAADPAAVGAIYTRIMQDLGANEAKLLDLNTHTDVISPHAVALVERATGVFFTGGDQVRIAQILGGTPLDRLLIRRHRAGLTVAGTSAGAAIMSSIMIVGGAGIGSLRTNNVELGTGMEFLPGAIIDQHFQQRWRFRRLLAAVAQYPHELGIGIDENTAIIVRDNQFTVLGEGSVTVMDGKRITHVTRPAPGNNTLLALCGVTIHVLTERMRYDLKNRVPLIEKEKEYASGRAAR